MSLLTISVGGAAGPEAPLVTTCGTLAGVLGRRRRLAARRPQRDDRRDGGGVRRAVRGPGRLGLFALEILQSTRSCGTTRLSYPRSSRASSATRAASSCPVPVPRPIGGFLRSRRWRSDLLWAVAAGIAGAGIAGTFSTLTFGLRKAVRVVRLVVRADRRRIRLATLALWSPYALTFGEGQTGRVLVTSLGLGALTVALVAKLLGRTVSCGWPGGFIIPLFFAAQPRGSLSSGAHGARWGVVCAAAMAAASVGVTKTLLGSTLVVSEMGGLRLLPTTLLAALK